MSSCNGMLAYNMAKHGFDKKGKNMVDVKEGSEKRPKQCNDRFQAIKKKKFRKYSRLPGVTEKYNTDSLTLCLVYNHLKEVSPKLASEFAANNKFPPEFSLAA